jgi:hypothetical protein
MHEFIIETFELSRRVASYRRLLRRPPSTLLRTGFDTPRYARYLIKQLAIRLSWQTTPAKSLVIRACGVMGNG